MGVSLSGMISMGGDFMFVLYFCLICSAPGTVCANLRTCSALLLALSGYSQRCDERASSA